MTAAIYARKSTEENDKAEEAKSVTRQIDAGRAFARAKGWTVADAHVFVDDGISGAEFEKRPGFMAMLAAARRREYRVLIVSEPKTLGRETVETPYWMKKLSQAGVEIIEYGHGQSLIPKSPLDKVMGSVQAFGDEAHREQTRTRTYEALRDKAAKGYVTGGRVFGYRNHDVTNGEDAHGRPKRSHVERVIVEEEARVVRYIFTLSAEGYGNKVIAKRLNSEGVRAPRPLKRHDGLSSVAGWSPSTVRSVLTRELYRGVVVWNRSRKRDDWGQKRQQWRTEDQWIRTEREDLRIVPEDLWQRVASRRRDIEHTAVRFASGRLSGRPPKNETRNLLAGLATCGVCGGGMVVETSPRKRGRVPEYVCHRHRHNGTCANKLAVSVETANEAVLQAIEEHVLTPEAVEHVIRLSERDDAQDRQAALEREAKDLDKRIARLIAAIESGVDAKSVAAKIREYEKRKAEIRAEQGSLRPVPRLAPSVIESRLAEWRRLLRQNTTQGRAVLQRVLKGRLTFAPRADGTGYDFVAPTRFDKLFSGVAVARPAFVAEGDTRGIAHILPEDTPEADYGRLLEKACGKGVASPNGPIPCVPIGGPLPVAA
jgi:site-specific DNA recombinase